MMAFKGMMAAKAKGKGDWGSKGDWASKGAWGGKGGFGKGFDAGFGGYGKGQKGKGSGKSLKDFDPEVKVWIGDMTETTTWKELQEHMNAAGKTKWVEVFEGNGKGTGAVAYGSAEEATNAIATLSGTQLGGATIVCDVWEKKEKTSGDSGSGKGKGKGWGKDKGASGKGWGKSAPKGNICKGWAPIYQDSFSSKGYGKGFFGGKGKGKKGPSLKDFAPETKVWIGDMNESTTWKELQEHMNAAGKTKWVEVFTGKGKGTGAVAYSTAEEAINAIATLSGSKLGDATIVCDVWEKQDKAEAA